MTEISQQALETARKILATCAAHDPWFPNASEATLLAWAHQISITNLTRPDLLAGVTAVYAAQGSGFKPLPADVITAARTIRQDRLQRAGWPESPQPPASAATRAAALNDTVKTIANRKSLTAESQTPRRTREIPIDDPRESHFCDVPGTGRENQRWECPNCGQHWWVYRDRWAMCASEAQS